MLRPIQPADHDAVLELNARNVELLAPMDEQRLLEILAWSDRADVIESEATPGEYTLVVHDTDESDGEGVGTSQDTKDITVE